MLGKKKIMRIMNEFELETEIEKAEKKKYKNPRVRIIVC